jgi:hypothetical protein
LVPSVREGPGIALTIHSSLLTEQGEVVLLGGQRSVQNTARRPFCLMNLGGVLGNRSGGRRGLSCPNPKRL